MSVGLQPYKLFSFNFFICIDFSPLIKNSEDQLKPLEQSHYHAKNAKGRIPSRLAMMQGVYQLFLGA